LVFEFSKLAISLVGSAVEQKSEFVSSFSPRRDEMVCTVSELRELRRRSQNWRIFNPKREIVVLRSLGDHCGQSMRVIVPKSRRWFQQIEGPFHPNLNGIQLNIEGLLYTKSDGHCT
jgi:hypothetical protein